MEAIYQELQFVGVSFLWGIVLLFAYDCFMIGRNCIPHARFVIAIEDFLFWILAGCSAFFVMYKMNHGIIRAFSIFTILAGMMAYHFTLSKYFVKWVSTLIQKAEKVVGKTIKIIFTPVIFCGKRVLWTCQWIGRRARRIAHSSVKGLKKVGKKVRIVNTKQ